MYTLPFMPLRQISKKYYFFIKMTHNQIYSLLLEKPTQTHPIHYRGYLQKCLQSTSNFPLNPQS